MFCPKPNFVFGVLLLSSAILAYGPAWAIDDGALPSNGVVKGGSADFNYDTPNELHINQHTDRVVIDWNRFDIGKNALTQFHQNSSSSIAVNKIVGSFEPSQILGALKSNGQIVILNQNGVIFGGNSRVDVGGIVASTGKIDENAFMRGDQVLKLTDIGGAGAIVNQGQINVAAAGLAAFVAPTVKNSGVINAKLGKVVLASGVEATVDLYGDGLVELAAPELSSALIENAGVISAEGGKVLLTARSANNIVSSVINTSGIINASSARQKGGKIILEGPSINVSGKIDASGKKGGGTIHIGGGWQGKSNNIKNAETVKTSSTAVIKANATAAHGDGGEVVLWADGNTQFGGTIEAKGGSLSGNGGKVETSAKKHLQVEKDAVVSVGSGNNTGKGGEWLIDPEDIVISNTGNDGNPATSDIAASTINNTLNAGGNVTVTTNAGMSGNGDITLSSASILKSTSNNDVTFTLQAHRDIVLNNSQINNTSANKLNVVLNADRDANYDGAIDIVNSSITTNGGYFVAGGGSGILFGADGLEGTADDAASTGADKISAWGNVARPSGVRFSTSSVITNGGNVYLSGHGWADSTSTGLGTSAAGVRLDSSSITTMNGHVQINGTGGGTGAGNYNMGIYALNNSNITTTGGNITALGTAGNGSGTLNQGVSISSVGTNFFRTTSGAIDITGHAASSKAAIGASGRIDLIGSGSITLTSTGGILQTNNTVGHATNASGNITYISDQVDISGGVVRTSGNVILRTYSDNTLINLGAGTGGMAISNTELSRITASKVIIGNSQNPVQDIIVDGFDVSTKTYGFELYGNDITVQDTGAAGYGLRLGTGDFIAHAKDKAGDLAQLSVNAAIQKQVGGVSLLDLRSDRDIVFSSGHVNATNGTLNVVLNADRNANQDGAISMTNSNVVTNNGWFVAGGGSGTLWGTDGIMGTADDGASTGADNVAAYGNSNVAYGTVLINSGITTNSGSIYIKGQAVNDSAGSRHGVFLSNAPLTTTTGSINIFGTGAGTGPQNYGVLANGASSITTGSGAINITGRNVSTGSGNGAYGMFSQGSIKSTSGNILIDVEASSPAGGANVALRMNGGTINSGSGAITITGIGKTGGTDFNISGGTIGGAGQTGDITLNANTFVNTGASINTTGTILLKPRTASTSIGLGGGAGTLNISDVALGLFNAGTLIIGDSINGTGNVAIDSWDLSAKSHHVQIFGNDVNLAGIILGSGNTAIYSKGSNGITIGADSLSNTTGNLTLLSSAAVRVNQRLENADIGTINIIAGWDGISGITTPASFNLSNVDFGSSVRNVTIGANGKISSNGTDTAVLIASTGNLINNSSDGSNAITTGAGRYLVYGTHPDDTSKGGLAAKSLYNQSYSSAAPASLFGGSRFIFTHQPTLTLTANDLSVTDPAQAVYSFSGIGLVNDDLLSDALSAGTATYLLSGAGNTRTINLSGDYTSPVGYNIVYANGTMTVAAVISTPPVPTPPAPVVVAPPLVSDQIRKNETIFAQATTPQNAQSEMAQIVSEYIDSADSSEKDSSTCMAVYSQSGNCLIN